MNDKTSIYPTRRQKAFFESNHVELQYHHGITSTAAMYFRFMLRIMILVYVIMAVISGFELFSILITKNAESTRQMVSLSKAFLMLTLILTMILMHNQVMLILGHGYKNKSAQIYVDRLSTVEECRANLSIIKSFFAFTGIMATIMLWILWGGYGTPFYNGLFGSQLSQVLNTAISLKNDDSLSASGNLIKPYLWIGSVSFLLVILMAVLGWIQAATSRIKIMGSK